jgi:hypothetical protein
LIEAIAVNDRLQIGTGTCSGVSLQISAAAICGTPDALSEEAYKRPFILPC